MNSKMFAMAAMLAMFGMFNNALAHTGVSYSTSLHSVLHGLSNITVVLALLAVVFFAVKRVPQVIKQRVKKKSD